MLTEEIAGQQTLLRRLGKGPRHVLALHCALAHGGAWNAMATALGDDFTLWAPDLPGHGLSAHWPEGRTQHDAATLIAIEIAERIGKGQAIDVLGHSFGGTVAVRLQQTRPDLVRTLTLFEPVLFGITRGVASAAAEDWRAKDKVFVDLYQSGKTEEAAQFFHSLWGNGTPLSDLPEHSQRYIIDRIGVIPAAADAITHDAYGLVAKGKVEAMNLPVLMMHGELSPPVMHTITELMAARLPNVKTATIQGAGHMLPLSHAKIIAPQLLAHFGQAAKAA